ncbi:septation protein A [Rhizobium sp. TH2]|uniref:septation protein A n=1 Tax=Rhizobium sp. TH2 TaxID=2775403 RepID=UPI0021585A2E|nr:septation protein A [Rhizobium sp. TH2]UVC12067.1 septation protein A [Rhizobium sp. TH2]
MAENTEETTVPAHKENVGLKLVLELGPLAVFFFANLYGEKLAIWFPALKALGSDIFIATGLFMAATVLSLVVSKLVVGKLPLMPLISGVVVLGFGALSIWLQNDLFVKMKPTIINTLFGVILLGGLFFGRSLLGYVFNSAFQLDDEGWNKLTLRWGLFFLFLAVLNEVLWRGFNWYYMPDDKLANSMWISSKIWVVMPVTFLFTLSQMPLIMKHSVEVEE